MVRKKGKRLATEDVPDDAPISVKGIHRISDQDIVSHFGTPPEAEDDTVGPSTSIVDVNLRLDKIVWQKAVQGARRKGLDLSRYVERAIERFESVS
ncbi:MAG: hypothetical protein UZ17_ACD001002911 [Acidobacteria bacterium OLB17]|nr:MAG: hypothetical protein UZ17_ACD001002911 [Acidobacteria bacterium OLB17]MCZ2391605.1 hypothetical protein [Acidobacteriota bacterium]